MEFSIELLAPPGGGPVLRVSGELDIENAPRLGESVQQQLAAAPAALVIDLTGTTYLDSRGARELALCGRRATAAGTALSVVCPRENRRLWRVFDLLGLDSAVAIHTSYDEQQHDDQHDEQDGAPGG